MNAPRHYPLARPMFWAAFVFLLAVAGAIHRGVDYTVVHPVELEVITWGLALLWPMIAVEAWVAVIIRDPVVRPLKPTAIRALWITLLPPMRMGMPCPWTGELWLPTWGWRERGKRLEDQLDRAFHKPMLLFALLILPVLALEFFKADEVRASRPLQLALHVGVAVIWVAFAFEFVVKVSAARRPFLYSKERWLDLAIVLLPMAEFILTRFADAAPLARLLRLSRAAAPEQLARMGQIYRLRGLLVKGFRALVVLRIIAKLTGNTPAKQLRKLELQIADAEIALAELKAQADALRLQCPPSDDSPDTPPDRGSPDRSAGPAASPA